MQKEFNIISVIQSLVVVGIVGLYTLEMRQSERLTRLEEKADALNERVEGHRDSLVVTLNQLRDTLVILQANGTDVRDRVIVLETIHTINKGR